MKCPNDGNTMRSMDEDWLCPVCFGRVPKGGDAKPVLKSSGLGELVYGKVQDPNSFEVPPAMVAYAKAVDNTKAAMVVPQRQFEAFISRIPRHALCPMCAAGTLYFDVQKKRWECTDVGGGNCGFGFDKAELIRAGGLDVLVSKVRNARRQPQFSMIDESVAVNFKAHYYTFRSEGQALPRGHPGQPAEVPAVQLVAVRPAAGVEARGRLVGADGGQVPRGLVLPRLRPGAERRAVRRGHVPATADRRADGEAARPDQAERYVPGAGRDAVLGGHQVPAVRQWQNAGRAAGRILRLPLPGLQFHPQPQGATLMDRTYSWLLGFALLAGLGIGMSIGLSLDGHRKQDPPLSHVTTDARFRALEDKVSYIESHQREHEDVLRKGGFFKPHFGVTGATEKR
jgi:rubredoxin